MRDFDDDEGALLNGDSGCHECGARSYRRSRVDGVCDECLAEAFGSGVADAPRIFSVDPVSA